MSRCGLLGRGPSPSYSLVQFVAPLLHCEVLSVAQECVAVPLVTPPLCCTPVLVRCTAPQDTLALSHRCVAALLAGASVHTWGNALPAMTCSVSGVCVTVLYCALWLLGFVHLSI